MRKMLGKLGIAFGILLLGLLACGWYTYRTTQAAPDFYTQALKVDTVAQEQAGDELETGLLELHNEVRDTGTWAAVFTQEQINGWLAIDLVQKFPDALPNQIQDPRISINPDKIELAFRYRDSRINGIVTSGVNLFLTEQPNELGVQLLYLRAGIIPLPLSQITDQITEAGARVGLPVFWRISDGTPVALISLPERTGDDDGNRWQITNIELREGQVYVSGLTEPIEEDAAE